MQYTPDNFLYMVKQLVSGLNGDDTPVAGGLLPGTSSAVTSSAQSADGGIKVDQVVPLSTVISASDFPAITDSTGGAASATFAAITAPAANATTSLTADMTAVKNALAQIALQLNAFRANFATAVSSVPAIATPSGSSPAIGTFSFAVPRDYDEASDHLAVFLEANSSNADAAITITGTATVAPIASQLVTSTAIVASTKSAVTAKAPFSNTNLNVTQEVQVFSINLSGYGLKRNDIVSVALAYAGTTTGTDYVYSVFRHYDSTIVSYNDTDNTDNPSTSGLPGVVANIQPGFGNPLR